MSIKTHLKFIEFHNFHSLFNFFGLIYPKNFVKLIPKDHFI